MALAEVTFPGRWSSTRPANVTNSPEAIDWTHEELLAALKRLVNYQAPGSALKSFCFFIDGLDEYHGKAMDIISGLRELSKLDNVKLCVARRPWTVFRNAFETVPQLRLETLTQPDVLRYVNGTLHAARSESLASSAQSEPFDQDGTDLLVQEIVDKAEGVFLWVFLVVKSVPNDLLEGDTVVMLRYRVSLFPRDLEEFFKGILDRVDDAYQWHTSQALRLAFKLTSDAENHGQAHTVSWFIDYWLIRQHVDGLADPRFSYLIEQRTLSSSDERRMRSETRTMLSAACKDLLQLPESQGADQESRHVEFLHRSVYDFLKSDAMQTRFAALTPGIFNSDRIFHLLNLARMKFAVAGRHWRPEEMSLAQPHLDLDREYVKAFSKPGCYGQRHILCSLPCQRCNTLVLKGLQSLHSTDATIWDMSEVRSVIRAALGFSSLNAFELWEVDLEILNAFLYRYNRYTQTPDGGENTRKQIDGLWEDFYDWFYSAGWLEYLRISNTTISVAQRRTRRLVALLMTDYGPKQTKRGSLIEIAGRLKRDVLEEEEEVGEEFDLQEHKRELCEKWKRRLGGT